MLKKLYINYMRRKRKKIFNKNTIMDPTVFIDYTAFCINETGNKKAIQINSGSCIRGGIYLQNSSQEKNFPQIEIGRNFYFGGGSIIGIIDKISIGNNVIISNYVHIYDNNNHPTSPKKRLEMSMGNDFFGDLWKWKESEHSPIVIQDNVWIGEYCSILKGVTIGEGSIIGCRSVVTKDVPAYSIVAGNPARVVKRLK